MTRPARWGTISSSGAFAGDVTAFAPIFQPEAPSAFVLTIRRLTTFVVEYLLPALRSATRGGAAVGWARSSTRTSDVEKSEDSIIRKRSERDTCRETEKPSSFSS